MFQGAKLIKDTPERPHVRCVVVGLGLADFRRHIVGCTLHCERLIISILKYLRDTKVTKFYRIIARYEYIL